MANIGKVVAVLLLSTLSFAQGARFDNFTWSVSPYNPGVSSPLVSIPAAAVSIYNTGTLVKAVTYTDATLATPCGSTSQLVLAGTSSCVSSSDAFGNFGFWAAPGGYDYYVTYNGTTVGPYPVYLGLTNDSTGILKNLNSIAFAEQYASLQAAITAVCDGTNEGIVYFKGTFSQVVTVPAHCTLDGLNRGTIKVPNNTNSSYAVVASNASDIHLRNFIIDGNKANQSPSGGQRTGGVTFTAVTDFDIDHVTVFNPYHHGIQILDGSARFKISHNTVHDNTLGSGIIIGTGTLTTGISDFTVDNNIIYNITGANCIFTTGPIGAGYGVSRGSLTGNNCNSPGDIGIEVGIGSQQMAVTGGTISGVANGQVGVLVRSAYRVNVNGVAVNGTASSTGIGIYVWNDTADATVFDTVTVNGSNVSGFNGVGGSGIAWSTVGASQNLGITGNTSVGNTTNFDPKTVVTGLYRSGNSDGVYISASNIDLVPASAKYVRTSKPLCVSSSLTNCPAGTNLYVFSGGNPQDLLLESSADDSEGVGFKTTVQNWGISLRSDVSHGIVIRDVTAAVDRFTFSTAGVFSAATINATTALQANGTPGASSTVVVKGSAGANCNLVFAEGLFTSTTCP